MFTVALVSFFVYGWIVAAAVLADGSNNDGLVGNDAVEQLATNAKTLATVLAASVVKLGEESAETIEEQLAGLAESLFNLSKKVDESGDLNSFARLSDIFVKASDSSAFTGKDTTEDDDDDAVVTPDNRRDEEDTEFIEPEVRIYPGLLSKETCRKIIELGESIGFANDFEPIDGNASTQAIDVLTEDGVVRNPELMALMEPYFETIGDLIKKQRNEAVDRIIFPDQPFNREPKLEWIFFRKYQLGTVRHSLAPHNDQNMHTVNIKLNDDFTGGGVYYIKPRLEDNPDWIPNDDADPGASVFRGVMNNDVPLIPEYQISYDYVNTLEGKNTTDGIVFPKLEVGDALIHNYTVWHAVAPTTQGARYSMVLFYDMDNPVMDDDDDDDEEEDEDDDSINVVIKHEIKECDPDTGKLVYIQDNIDVTWVDPDSMDFSDDRGEALEVITSNLRPGREISPGSYVGHVFRAIRSVPRGGILKPLEEREVLASIVIAPNQTDYNFVSSFTTQDDCYVSNSIESEEL